MIKLYLVIFNIIATSYFSIITALIKVSGGWALFIKLYSACPDKAPPGEGTKEEFN